MALFVCSCSDSSRSSVSQPAELFFMFTSQTCVYSREASLQLWSYVKVVDAVNPHTLGLWLALLVSG